MLKIKTKGYLMVEILIALVIFSIAIIALLSLQLVSNSGSQSSSTRLMANNYAYDMIDKMRSNQSAVIAGLYLNYNIGTNAGTDNNCRSINFNTLHTAVNCNSAQIAQDDLKEFSNQITSTLPQGKAVICLDSKKNQGTPTIPNCDGLGNEYVIKIYWKDRLSKLLNKNDGFSQVIIGSDI